MLETFLKTFQEHLEISFLMQNAAVVISTLLVALPEHERGRDYLRSLIAVIISLFVMMTCSIFSISLGGTYFPIIWNLLQAVFVFVVVGTVSKMSPGQKAIQFCSQVTNLTAVLEIVNDVSRIGSMYHASDPVLWFLRSFSGLLLIPCALLVRRWSFNHQTDMLHSSSVALAAVICGISEGTYLLVLGASGDRGLEIYLNANVTLLVMTFFLSILAINLIYRYMLYQTVLLQNSIVELQANAQDKKRVEELITVSQENVERMREVRHDIKNQFGYLRALAEKGDIKQVQTYLEELSFDFLKPLKAVNCGNENMNAILNMELAKAQSLGIDLDFQVIVPESLPFLWSDLCSLVTNVIDNAMENCNAGTERPVVQVRMLMQGEELLFSVSNPTDKESSFLDDIHSTKEDQEAHGFGHKIIHRIVQKYHGYDTCEINQGQFVFTCMLNS